MNWMQRDKPLNSFCMEVKSSVQNAISGHEFGMKKEMKFAAEI
jgi:hypothetical protein